METRAVIPDPCPQCGGELLYVFYYGSEGEPVGGHRVCANCGPRSMVEIDVAVDVRRKLLERKAS
jgi:hypothetical protein